VVVVVVLSQRTVVEGELAIEFAVVERRTTRFDLERACWSVGVVVGVFAIVELVVERCTTRFDLERACWSVGVVVGVFAIVELAVERVERTRKSSIDQVVGGVERTRRSSIDQVVGGVERTMRRPIGRVVEGVERTMRSSRFLVFVVDRILGCMIAIDLVEYQHLAYRARRKPCWSHPKRYHLGMIRRTYVHRRT